MANRAAIHGGTARPGLVGLLVVALAGSFLVGLVPRPAAAAGPPPGFTDEVVMSGSTCSSVAGSTKCLLQPTNIEFAPDGRLFVTEKRGVVKVFDDVSDRTPELVADMRTQVFNESDSGMLGLALDPSFPSRPYLYVSYAHDAPPGGTAPTYGTADQDDDPVCTGESCPKGGRVVKLTLSGSQVTQEQVLVEGSCHPFASHGIDDLHFGPDGALYATTGDGATSSYSDYGQGGNRCADPPTPSGTAPAAGTSEAGALRAQDARTTADPMGLNGTLIRINPDTGAGSPGNPYASSPDPNMRRVASFGLRNPFRFAFRPGSQSSAGGPEAYIADVGWNSYEEIDVAQVGDTTAENFGWPCYEGSARQPAYDNLDIGLCESLYSAGTATAPFYSYHHNDPIPGTSCPDNDAGALGGIVFYPGGPYPDEYDGALFFADFTKGCLMVMKAGPDGRPLASTLTEFGMVQQAGRTDGPWAVDLIVGPDGFLYYIDLYYGILHRITYSGGTTNRPPTAVALASPSSGPVGTAVSFDASGSRDPEGGPLAFAWDLDGDGGYDDASGPTAARTYTTAGRVAAGVQVTDSGGATARAAAPVEIGSPPTVTIDIAEASRTWHVGEQLSLTGSASEASGAAVPNTSLRWSTTLFHCDGADCHPHPQTGASGSTLSFEAPDHSAPAYLQVTLTATGLDGTSGSSSVRLDPDLTTLTLTSTPSGLQLGLDGAVGTTPFTRSEIVGSSHSVSASSQTLDGRQFDFKSWSDGGASAHNVLLGTTPRTIDATFEAVGRTVVVQAEADSMVRQSVPGTTHGSVTGLRSDGQATTTSSRDTSYLRFAVPALAAGESVTAASLSLSATSGTVDGPKLWRTSTGWDEATMTWSSGQPGRTGTSPVGDFTGVGTGRVSTPLSGPIESGLLSLELYADSSDSLDFSSREHSTLANRPQLILTISSDGTPPPVDTTPPPAPTVSPVSGNYTAAQSVTMADSEAGAVIRYTVAQGTTAPADPTSTSPQYTGPITVSASSVIRAAAFDAAGNRSPVVQRDYTISTATGSSRTVVVQAEADSMVRQSVPGTTHGSVTGLRSDGQASTTSSRDTSYLRFAVPALAAGESVTAASLSLSATSGTVDGPKLWRTSTGWDEATMTWSSGQPGRTGTSPVGDFTGVGTGRVSTPLSGPIESGLLSLELYADSSDSLDFSSREHSTLANRPQLILTISSDGTPPPVDTTPPPAPTVSPVSGNYTAAQSVTMADSEAGAVIRYTVAQGTTAPADPTSTSPQYTGPITVSASSVIRAAAFDAAGNRSPVVQRDYTISTATGSSRTVVVQAEADSMVRQSVPGTTHGSVTGLRSDGQATTTSSRDTSYLRFAVPALAAGESVTAASLSLSATSGTVDGPKLWRTSTGWDEATMTWSSGQPGRTGTSPVGDFTGVGTGRVSTPLSGPIESGLLSLELYADSSDSLDFSSREHSTLANRPQLILTITTP